MKLFIRYMLFFAIVGMAGIITTSCSDDDDTSPVINYVRVTKPASADSLIEAAYLGNLIAIMGDNPQDVREIWFDDQRANINPTLVTKTTIIVTVPESAPKAVSNTLKLVFANGGILEHQFQMSVPVPILASMECEWVKPGETAKIIGDYFFEPIKIQLADGSEVEPSSVKAKELTFVVPDGAAPGPITVTTNFGKTTSSFWFLDNRNIILNWDDLTSSGSWRPGTTSNSEGLDGNYLILKGSLKTNERTEDYPGGGYVMQLWSKVNGRPEGPLVPAGGFVNDYVFKFEARVKEWYGSTLNICFAPYDQKDKNDEYWGNLNAKGLWKPWEAADATFKTEGWTTVTIPMADFKFAQVVEGEGVVYKDMAFSRDVTGSLSFWVIGSPKAKSSGSPVEVHIDNVRIVTK